MKSSLIMSRREALMGFLILPLVAWLGFGAGRAMAQPATRSRVLVAYFTRTGNTRVIATQIARARGAALFQIEPLNAYPEEYDAQVAQATDERERGYEPPLKAKVTDLSAYDTVFLGFPVWGQSAPSIVRSFLSKHHLSGKTLVPFITHGGYGTGDSLAVVTAHAPGARRAEGFIKQCDQERETLEEVTKWLEGVPTP